MSFGQVSANHKMQIIRGRKESWRGSQASPRAQMQDVATWLASDGHEWRELECLTESQRRGERKVWDKPAWPGSSQGGLCSVNDRRHCLVILFVTVSLCVTSQAFCMSSETRNSFLLWCHTTGLCLIHCCMVSHYLIIFQVCFPRFKGVSALELVHFHLTAIPCNINQTVFISTWAIHNPSVSSLIRRARV